MTQWAYKVQIYVKNSTWPNFPHGFFAAATAWTADDLRIFIFGGQTKYAILSRKYNSNSENSAIFATS